MYDKEKGKRKKTENRIDGRHRNPPLFGKRDVCPVAVQLVSQHFVGIMAVLLVIPFNGLLEVGTFIKRVESDTFDFEDPILNRDIDFRAKLGGSSSDT